MHKSRAIVILFLLSATNLFKLQAQEDKNHYSNLPRTDSIVILDAIKVEAYQVSGSLRSIPGSLSVLTGESIVPADGTNLASALNTLPGISMQSGTYTTNRIVIRGMGSRTPYNTNRIRSYLNDIPLTTSDGVSTPEEIDLQSIGRLELVKGPSSALYGSGLGGSINLYTPVIYESEGNTGVQYGSFNTGKVNITGTLHRNNASFGGSLGHMQSDGYRENNYYERTSFLATAGWKRSLWSVNFTFMLMDIDGGIPSSVGKTLFDTDPQAAAPNWKTVGGYKKYVKGLAGITLTNNLSEHLTNRLTVFGRAHDNYEKRPFNNLDDRTVSAGLRNKLSLHFGKTDWVLGAEWIAEEYLWKLDTNTALVNQNRENRNLLNVFVMVYYRPGSKLNISLAGAFNLIRYRLTDLYMYNGDQAGTHVFPLMVSPRIGINFTPYEHWALYASAGHGFSMPSPEETLLPEGDVNQDIKPEQGFQFEIGSRLNFLGSAFGLDGTLYWIELDDLLVTKRVTEDIFTGVNAGKTRHQGFELLFNSRIFGYTGFPGKLTSVFTYTRSWNRFIDFSDDGITYDGNHLPGIPNQMLYLKLEWNPLQMFEMNADMMYTGDQFLDDGNTLNYAGYVVSNLKFSARFQTKKAGKFIIYTGINNLTGTHYASMLIVNARGFNNSEPRYYYPGLPRHVYAGIQYFLININTL
jgi:iron complex outermembrane receptor protein